MSPDDRRYVVDVPSIDPRVPERCVGCLGADAPHRRRLVFRRSDGAVERVCAVYWPYCGACLGSLAALDKSQRLMTWTGAAQMLVVIYAVGGAMGHYDFWWPALGILAGLFGVFVRHARRARRLWDLEWARIDDVYKGARGARLSFRRRDYAELFAQANQSTTSA